MSKGKREGKQRVETELTFAAWLRQRRRLLDLTQTALAERVGYSVVTIRKLERDELRPSKQLADRLVQSLEIPLAQQADVISLARSAAAPPLLADALPVQSSASSHLPQQLTPFFGRTAELLEIDQLLDQPTCRLLTLVGPGGIGKTRLALEIAQANVAHTPDGVYFISLAPLRSSEHIVPAIAEALTFQFQADNRPPQQQLLDYLRDKQILLLLDNFEHLLDGVEIIQALLQGCPTLRLLATSRERLHLSSETVFTLDGMDFPSGATVQEMLTYSAIQLFITTARRTRPKFALDHANAQEIVQVCRLVGGMPLAITLAAAWVEVLSPAEIVAELSHGFGFLEAELRDLPDRHRSMSTVLAQSWQRLTAAERVVFMRLSVFRGGFTRDAAQSVAGASLQTLGAFVNKSLVQRDANGRYTLHELLRQYAEAELKEAGQMADACAAHCANYTIYFQQHEADLKWHRQVAALDEIERDFENVRAAWQWAVAQRDYNAIGVALESLYWFCETRIRLQEGLELLRVAREQLAPLANEAPHPVWGRVMARMFGQNSVVHEPPSESRTRVETGLAIAQKEENQVEIAFCLWRLGMTYYLSDDSANAIPYLEASLAHYETLNDRFYQGYLLKDLGIVYITLGQSERGAEAIEQSLNLRREIGDLDGIASSISALGWILYNQGHCTEAEAYWQESQQLRRTTGSRGFRNSRDFELAWLGLFNRGDLDKVRALTEKMQRSAAATKYPTSTHRSSVLMGFLAGMSEEYQRCREIFQQLHTLKFTYFPFTTSWEQMGLCLAACGLDDLPAASERLQRILKISLIHQWPPNSAIGLTFAAILAAKSNQPERASELLGLVFHHPLSPKGWLTQWPLITRLRTELEATLTPERFAAAWAQGTSLDLMTTSEAVMTELARDSWSATHRFTLK